MPEMLLLEHHCPDRIEAVFYIGAKRVFQISQISPQSLPSIIK